MGISTSEFSRLSKELTNSLKDISQQIDYLQDQMDSLATVVLQNGCGLDLLIVAQGDMCALLLFHQLIGIGTGSSTTPQGIGKLLTTTEH
jgi:conjugal transfer/entry exclusion protein